MRAFIHLRQTLASQKEITKELTELKTFVLKHSHSNDREFKRIWTVIEKLTSPAVDKEQRQIGFDLS